jgi:hypothetical protein
LDRSDRVAGSGGLILAYSIGAIFGPLAASSTMNYVGAASLFVFTGVVGTSALVFGLWRMTVRPSVATDLRSSYPGLPRATPVVLPSGGRARSALAEHKPSMEPQHEG